MIFANCFINFIYYFYLITPIYFSIFRIDNKICVIFTETNHFSIHFNEKLSFFKKEYVKLIVRGIVAIELARLRIRHGN